MKPHLCILKTPAEKVVERAFELSFKASFQKVNKFGVLETKNLKLQITDNNQSVTK